ncbi:MAG: DNA repair exonuclease [Desulfovibrionaceae bacterium]|nr:DNA repair exonuclease [Desulfovibrionaceae bacterium]
MPNITFIHSADLHLDAPFKGLSKNLLNGERLSKQLQEATFAVIDRLEKLCLDQKPDFLVLAGDLTNSEEQSVRARLRLVRLCENLKTAGIRVFIIHGNHDPKAQTFKSINFPDNVTIFGDTVTRELFIKEGQVQAVIHGLSHETRFDSRNVTPFFKRDQEYDQCFQLGLLHCTLGASSDSDNIQPATIKELKETNLDAWALGHVHKPGILAKDPFIAYAGSPQGLDITEDGPHGCYLVHACKNQDSWQCEATFQSLAPIIWQTIIQPLDELNSLEKLVLELETKFDKIKNTLPPNCRSVIVKIILTGQTKLEQELNSGLNDLMAELALAETGTPGLYIRDIELATTAAIDLNEYLKRDDLLGYCLRQVELMQKEDDLKAFVQKTLNPLFGHSQLRKLIKPLSDDDLSRLLQDAAKLCIAQLEDQRVY